MVSEKIICTDKSHYHTSKIFLGLVILLGLVMLFIGLFENVNNLIGYGVILGATAWNRMDSRSRAYRASLCVGGVTVSMEADDDDRERRVSGDSSIVTTPDIRPGDEGTSPEAENDALNRAYCEEYRQRKLQKLRDLNEK